MTWLSKAWAIPRPNAQPPKEQPFELASCSAAVLLGFCTTGNNIPRPKVLGQQCFGGDTVGARRRGRPARGEGELKGPSFQALACSPGSPPSSTVTSPAAVDMPLRRPLRFDARTPGRNATNDKRARQASAPSPPPLWRRRSARGYGGRTPPVHSWHDDSPAPPS